MFKKANYRKVVHPGEKSRSRGSQRKLVNSGSYLRAITGGSNWSLSGGRKKGS